MRRLFLFATLAWSTVAFSADISVLHDGPLLADGSTTHRVYLGIPGLSATDKVKLKTREGTVVGYSIPMPGLLAMDLLGEPVESAATLSLRLRVKGGIELDKVVSLPVGPAAVGSLSIGLDPPNLIAGLQRVTVRIRPQGAAHLPSSSRQFALAASTGEIESLEASSDGTWTAFYIPPVDLEESTVVLFTATDLSAPESVVGFASLALGESVATPSAEDEAPAWKTEHGRLAFAPLPEGVGVPAGRTVRLHLAAVNAHGLPVMDVSEALYSVGGMLEFEGGGNPVVSAVAPGLFAVDIVVPHEPGPFSVVAQPGDFQASISLESVGALPSLSLRSDPEFLTKDTRDLTLITWAKDANGRTLPGRTLGVEVAGGTVRGAVEDGGDGSYTAKVRMDRGAEKLKVNVRPDLATSKLPPAQLRIWTLADAVPLGTTSEMAVGVIVEDAFGLPVAGMNVDLAVPIGGGALPPKVETGDTGIGHVRYVPGLDAGPALLSASVEGGLKQMVLLWQVPVGQSAPLLMMPGTEESRLDSTGWRLAFPSTTLVRGAAPVRAPVVAAAPRASTPEALPTALDTPTAPETSSASSEWTPLGADSASVSDAPPPGGPLSRFTHPLRVIARIQYTGYEFSQVADEYDSLPGTTESPATLSVRLPKGVVGLGLAAEYWLLDEDLAADLSARWGRYVLDLGEGQEGESISDLQVGLRYRASLGSGFNAEGGVWLHRMDMAALRYKLSEDPDTGKKFQSSAELVSFGIMGARIGGAVDVALGPMELKLDLSETFAPKPASTHLGLGAQVNVEDAEIGGMPLLLDLRYSMDLRHLALPVDGLEAQVVDLQHAFLFGAGFAL